MHWSVGHSYHVHSWAAHASVIDSLAGKTVIHGITEIVEHFVFDLTSDVIVDLEAKFRVTVCDFMYGHIICLLNFKIGREPSEISAPSPPPIRVAGSGHTLTGCGLNICPFCPFGCLPFADRNSGYDLRYASF